MKKLKKILIIGDSNCIPLFLSYFDIDDKNWLKLEAFTSKSF